LSFVENVLFDVLFYVTLERPESRIPVVKEEYVLAIDCAASLLPHACIEYRDNATSIPRWLSVRVGKVYSSFRDNFYTV